METTSSQRAEKERVEAAKRAAKAISMPVLVMSALLPYSRSLDRL